MRIKPLIKFASIAMLFLFSGTAAAEKCKGHGAALFPFQQFKVALEYLGSYDNADQEQAICFLRKAAGGGHVEAMSRLAFELIGFESPNISNEVRQEGQYWAKKAAERGDPYWQYRSHVFEDNYEIQLDWEEKAANSNYLPAAVSVFEHHYFHSNFSEAEKWLSKANFILNKNSNKSDTGWKDILEKKSCEFYFDIRRHNEALNWCLKASEHEDVRGETKLNLGHIYKNGLGLVQSCEKSFYWYNRSATEDLNVEAQLIMGKAYEAGSCGLPKDLETAVTMYYKASKLIGVQGLHEATDKFQSICSSTLAPKTCWKHEKQCLDWKDTSRIDIECH